MQRQIVLDGWVLSYEFSRKQVKNINLRIRSDGTVAVSAPRGVAVEQVESFLRKKQDVLRRATEQAKRPPQRPLSKEDQERCLSRATELLEQLYPAFAAYGVPEPRLRVREMRSRWGSCIPAKQVITLNARLVDCGEDCMEYILVHELCHFLQADHSPRFYGWMDHFLPQWRERRQKLREHE